jgi:hypothetical protein
MVVSMAQGMEDPEVIAEKHGFTGEKWEKLKVWKPFLDAVAAQRAELDKSGYSFRVKAAWKAEDLADDYYLMAKRPDASFSQIEKALNFFTRVGALEPKEDKTQQGGEGFSVTINMNGAKTTVSGQSTGFSDKNTFDMEDNGQENADHPRGYMIAPLIDPTLFAEMAENREA